MTDLLIQRRLVVCLLLWLTVVVPRPVTAAHPVLDSSVLDPSILRQTEADRIQTEKPVETQPTAERSPLPQTQKDWIVSLVDACGWSFGLPDEPRIEDYLAILAGTRLLRVEAEEAKQELDSVSVKNFRTYGRFSGSGWVSGIATPTKIHLKFLVPLTGPYRLTASLRLAGFRFHVGDQTLTADGGRGFGRVELGTLELFAGQQEVVVEIPPNASIDYLELEGAHAPKIAPPGGWKIDAPLTFEVIASTALQVLGLEYLLPLSDDVVSIEAEVIADTDRAKIVASRHLGAPSGGKWLRAGAGPARLELPLMVDQAGLYDIGLRAAASRALKVTINGRVERQVDFPAYLDTRNVGTFRLNPGSNRISVELPPRAGIDLLTIRRRSEVRESYRRLAGLADEGLSLSAAANDVLRILSKLGAPR